MSNSVIEAYHISKKINNQIIIKDITFSIPKNSITLIEGHNGSGKSVTLKIISGLINSFDGSLLVNGKVSFAVDIFPENLNLTINDYFQFLSKLYPSHESNELLDYFIKQFELLPLLNRKLKDCSKGTKQKVNIIQCLIKSADIYILDEPFSGLDEDSTQFLLDYLYKLKLTTTIVLTSHEYNIYKNIATYTLNIETGKFDTIKKENASLPHNNFKLIIIKHDLKIYNFLSKYQNIKDIHIRNDKLYIQTHQNHLNEILKKLIDQQCEILEIKDVFVS